MGKVTRPSPLSESDERGFFDCGKESINNWFQRHAWSNHATGASRINVIKDLETGRIVGFVSLSASQIERAFLPKPLQRNRPDPLPVTLLGQLAVDRNFQGHGHATALLFFALRTALSAAEIIGSVGVIAHPLDERLRQFYAKWGFIDLPFDPRRAMIVRMIDLQLSFSSGRD